MMNSKPTFDFRVTNTAVLALITVSLQNLASDKTPLFTSIYVCISTLPLMVIFAGLL
jgi:hypothetical protein